MVAKIQATPPNPHSIRPARGSLAGFCCQLFAQEPPFTGCGIHGLNLVFLPSLKRRIRVDNRGNKEGVGRSLCQYGERLLKSRGYVLGTLWVFRGSEGARRFYEATGFGTYGASKTLDLGLPLEAIRYRKGIRNVELRAARSTGGEL